MSDTELLQRLVALNRAVRAHASPLQTQTLFADFMLELAMRHGTRSLAVTPRFESAVRRVRERMDADPADDSDLAALAAGGGIAPLQLLRAFRRSIGCTPQVYRTAQRLRVAKRALAAGQSLAQAALEAGFCDPEPLHACISALDRVGTRFVRQGRQVVAGLVSACPPVMRGLQRRRRLRLFERSSVDRVNVNLGAIDARKPVVSAGVYLEDRALRCY